MYHIGQSKLTAVKNTPNIAVKHSVVVIVGDIGEKLDLRYACIIHKRINRSEPPFSFGKKSFCFASLGNIRLYHHRIAAAEPYLATSLSGLFFTCIVIYDYIISLCGKELRRLCADAPRRACYQYVSHYFFLVVVVTISICPSRGDISVYPLSEKMLSSALLEKEEIS